MSTDSPLPYCKRCQANDGKRCGICASVKYTEPEQEPLHETERPSTWLQQDRGSRCTMSAELTGDMPHLIALTFTFPAVGKLLRAYESLTADVQRLTEERKALEQAIDAAMVELENAYVMNSQDAGPVVCASVVHDIATALRAARSKP